MQGYFTILYKIHNLGKSIQIDKCNIHWISYHKCILITSIWKTLFLIIKSRFRFFLERSLVYYSNNGYSWLWWSISKIIWRKNSWDNSLYLGNLFSFILYSYFNEFSWIHTIWEQILSITSKTSLERDDLKVISKSSCYFI